MRRGLAALWALVCSTLVAAVVLVGAATFFVGRAEAAGPERRLEWSCAGDGNPTSTLSLSALGEGQATAWAGSDADVHHTDASGQAGFIVRAVRLELCGRVFTHRGRVWYRLGYEPWNVFERATPGASSWGKILSAEVGWAPWSWLAFSLGVRKLDLFWGHDEPEEALVLPVRPFITTSVAPDRRWGLVIDDDFGVAHIIIGVYQGAQNLNPTLAGGLLLTARLKAEPLGPVGYTLSTLYDDPRWRKRPRFGLNASVLLEYTSQFSGYVIGADVPFKWGPLGVGVEYVYASSTREEGPIATSPAPVWSRQGAWAGFALMMWRPYLELAGRWDWLDVNGDPLRQFHSVSAGLNAYLWKSRARLQAAYTHKFLNGFTDDSLLFLLTLSGSVAAK